MNNFRDRAKQTYLILHLVRYGLGIWKQRKTVDRKRPERAAAYPMLIVTNVIKRKYGIHTCEYVYILYYILTLHIHTI